MLEGRQTFKFSEGKIGKPNSNCIQHLRREMKSIIRDICDYSRSYSWIGKDI